MPAIGPFAANPLMFHSLLASLIILNCVHIIIITQSVPPHILTAAKRRV
jgi:hypothetical protein